MEATDVGGYGMKRTGGGRRDEGVKCNECE